MRTLFTAKTIENSRFMNIKICLASLIFAVLIITGISQVILPVLISLLVLLLIAQELYLLGASGSIT